MSVDKPKRKRPGRAEASKIRRSLSESVVKVSLPGLLVPQDAGCRMHDGMNAFCAELEAFVENI